VFLLNISCPGHHSQASHTLQCGGAAGGSWGAAVSVPLCWPRIDQLNECASNTRRHVDGTQDLTQSDKEGRGRTVAFGAFADAGDSQHC